MTKDKSLDIWIPCSWTVYVNYWNGIVLELRVERLSKLASIFHSSFKGFKDMGIGFIYEKGSIFDEESDGRR